MARAPLMIAVMLAACSSEKVPQPTPQPPAVSTTVPVASAPEKRPSFDDPARPDLPQVRTLKDLQAHAEKLVELHGRYEVTPIRRGKAPHPVFIVLADGQRVVRSYGLVRDELRFDHQSVVVIGHVFPMGMSVPGKIQQMGAHHIEVESLSLNPMASPFAHRAEIMTPVTVASAEDVKHFHNHWVQVFGQMAAVDPAVIITLPDGSPLSVTPRDKSAWSTYLGKSISVIGMLDRASGLSQTGEVCAGRVERCGMTKR